MNQGNRPNGIAYRDTPDDKPLVRFIAKLVRCHLFVPPDSGPNSTSRFRSYKVANLENCRSYKARGQYSYSSFTIFIRSRFELPLNHPS